VETLQSLFLLFNVGFLVEKQQIAILQSSVWKDRGLKTMNYHNQSEHSNQNTTDVGEHFNYYTTDVVSPAVEEDSR